MVIKLVTSITFYGGVNEVGGNKILVNDKDTNILLDFGASFTTRDKFYSTPFLSPKSGIDLVELGILPNLKGAYSFDDSMPEIDAVFLSHSHMDHSAHIAFLKREIPIYCGETTARILHALSDIHTANIEFDLRGIKYRTFRTGDRIKVGSIEIKPVHVDHSVPGSYGFIVYTPSATIVYTGDFRRHGLRPELTEDFISESSSEHVDVAICENTNMTCVELSSESEVMEKLNYIIGRTSGLVLTDFAYADIDRLRSFYEAAIKNNRQLVISMRQAYILHRLGSDPHLNIPRLKDENILIFQKEKKKYFKWEQEMLKVGETIRPYDVSKRQNGIVLSMSFFDLGWLIDIDPMPGSCYILSASEPFNEEMEIDFNRLLNWLEHYGLPQYHVHVSGHIMPLHLREALKAINPKKIFPIHGDYPNLFSRFMRDLNSEIVVPEKGRKYEV